MTFEEFEALGTKEQENWLNEQLEAGLSPEDIYEALGTTKQGIGKIGVFYVPPKKAFNIKPMRGYQTTKLSGNEGGVTTEATIIGAEKIG